MNKNTPFLILIFLATAVYGNGWIEKNSDLQPVFHDRVWRHIRAAGDLDLAGHREEADALLRKALKTVDEVRPFLASSWPKGWPRDERALMLLRYATPDAYLYRIIGDYAWHHGRSKESLRYYELYLQHSIIPDTDYMMKMAGIFEAEESWREAKIIYENMYRTIESRNFRGRAFSLQMLGRKIKNIELNLREISLLLMDITFRDIEDFIRSDFQKMLTGHIERLEGFNAVARSDFNRVVAEENLQEDDFKYTEEMSKLAKLLNADYILRPSLTKIDEYFIFQVDVFDPERQIWFESYEYKTHAYQYLANLIHRFRIQFKGAEKIPPELFLPENVFLWTYETDSSVNDLRVSIDGRRIIAGCSSGTVYIFNGDGKLLREFSMPEKILNVSISPCGGYFSWTTLEGRIYFADQNGVIRWNQKLGNQGRGIDIADEGRFMVVGINDEIIFKDRRGEQFWNLSVPRWITSIKISGDSRRILAGMENGAYWCISDEGNALWQKNLEDKIVDIKISGGGYNAAVTETGKTFVFDREGNEIVRFEAGQDIGHSVFKPEIIKLMSGRKSNYTYILSHDGQQLWKFNLSPKTDLIDALPDGKMITTAEGRNIFAFSIDWK